jgi:hypothetical protein
MDVNTTNFQQKIHEHELGFSYFLFRFYFGQNKNRMFSRRNGETFSDIDKIRQQKIKRVITIIIIQVHYLFTNNLQNHDFVSYKNMKNKIIRRTKRWYRGIFWS